jgi:hypothetical protein
MPLVAELRRAPTDLAGADPSEPLCPAPHDFKADDDPARCQQVLDHPQAEQKSEIEPDSQLDDVRREPIAAINGLRCCHHRAQIADVRRHIVNLTVPLQRFVSIHDPIANVHNCPRHAMSSSDDRALRSGAMVAWREIVELGVAAQCQRKAPRLRMAAIRQVDSTVWKPLTRATAQTIFCAEPCCHQRQEPWPSIIKRQRSEGDIIKCSPPLWRAKQFQRQFCA